MTFTRYVAIGDSSTEGLEDPGTNGRHRGWADRLALHVAQAQGAPLLYANLAIRGRKTREVRDEQLAPALAMQPDLASVFAGTNDIIRSQYDEAAVIDDLRAMHRAFRDIGATVVTITMPDLSEIAPFAERARPRLLLRSSRWPAIRGCGTRTACMRTPRVTRASPPASPRCWACPVSTARGPSRCRRAVRPPHGNACVRRRIGSLRISPRGCCVG